MWTYSLADLATVPRDQVRFLVKDTDFTNQLVQDEEINFVLSRTGTVDAAAAQVARSIAVSFAQLADRSAGDTSIKYNQSAKYYFALAAQFTVLQSFAAVPYAGGISLTDKINQEQDADRVIPQFNIGMDDSLLPVPPAGNIINEESESNR